MTRYRHKKRGTVYELVGIGTFVNHDPAYDMDDVCVAEVAPGVWHVRFAFASHIVSEAARVQGGITAGELVAIYRAVLDPTEIWVRARAEFNDGRFEELAE